MSIAQLLVVLDGTIVNIALPSAQAALGMSDASRQWAITAYALAFGGLLLIGGRVGSAIGHRRTFIIGLVGFAASSALGGAAVNPETLFAARALQGLFAAALAPAGMSLLTITFTGGRERGRAFGVFGAVGAAGSAVGLIAGGALTEYVGWRWCLLINVPIALLAVFAASALVPRDRPARTPSDTARSAAKPQSAATPTGSSRTPHATGATGSAGANGSADPRPLAGAGRFGRRSRRLDVPGALLSAVGFAAVVYAFNEAEPRGWSSPRVLALLATGVLLLAGFVAVEVRSSNPLLPMRVLAHRARAGAFVSITLMFVAMFGFYLFMSYYVQGILGYSPIQAGLTLIINALAALVSSTFIAGKLHGRVPPAALILPGLIAAAAGMLLLTRLTPHTTDVLPLYLTPALILTGLGLGCVIPATAALATVDVRHQDIGAASAAYNASQQLGAALGTALLNTIATSAAASHLATSRDATPVAASVHGYTTALAVASVILIAAACVTAPLMARRTRGRPPQ
ncbi:MFS transporter [Actinomadura sp. 9N215]|uniref:MFS transporter n=1 Tax=Actinomadura sp. 9N215 TaxID=3375150 RepID=UPI00379CC568